MAEFLLIHGSCHGAWCWRDLIPPLTRAGHGARAIDLPSHGDDPTPLAEVTLERYAEAIVAAIDATRNGPVVLVGHSMAGFPITRAAELAPDKIARLIYLCAYVPQRGLSLVEMRKQAPRQPLMPAVIRAEDGASFTVDPAMAGDIFYHDCSDAVRAYALPRLCAQAVAPQSVPVAVTDRARALPRDYILCTQDRTIPPEYQETMVADWSPARVYRLASGHSPFFSMPARLAETLIRIAEGP